MNTKTVLIVDDDPDFIFQQQHQLQALGYRVISASNRQDAIRLLDQKPQAAIIDLMMQEQDDGFILAHEFKKRVPHMPVIMVTAVASETGLEFESVTPEEKTWIKADAVFSKPVRTEQLVREIERLMS